VADRHDLWRLLLRMTARKVVDLKRRETRQRRGGGRAKLTSAHQDGEVDLNDWTLAQAIGNTPTPEFAAMMTEECRRLLDQLGDQDLQAMAIAKMQGYENREIADQLDCSVRTVERRLQLIRSKWELEQPP
jgi:DNA-directed RNA polymerase specialized sigma24 family protein